MISRLLTHLNEPVEGKFLSWFRILAFGLIVFEVTELYAGGYLSFVLSATDIRFPYEFLPIATKFKAQYVDLLYAVVVGSAGLCAIGLFYRYATWVFLLSYSYLFFQDKLFWNNHWYLFALIGILAIIIDMSKSYSLDIILRPKNKRATVPRWFYAVLAFQVAIAYFYGGISKINPDWLIQTEPIGRFLSERTHYPILGHIFQQPWAPYFFAYGGLLFDLSIGFLLFWKRTWYVAVVLVIMFNGLNTLIFDIGTFPFFMVASLILFYGVNLPSEKHAINSVVNSHLKGAQLLVVSAFVMFQVAFPLRQFLYSGSPSWIGICERFSWRMMIQFKDAEEFDFYVYERDFDELVLVETDLSDRQRIGMMVFPEMIAQYAEGMRKELEKNGAENIEIRARIQVSMNGRPNQYLVDKNYDLSRDERKLWEAPKYVVPEAY